MTTTVPKPAFRLHSRLKERVSPVTGSMSGIGLGIVRALAQVGAAIAVSGGRPLRCRRPLIKMWEE